MSVTASETQPSIPFCTPEGPFFGLAIPFMSYIGLKPEALGDGTARARLPANPNLVNSREDIHGGTLMSVMDFLLSVAARSHDPLGVGVLTIEFSCHFLEAARGELTFESRLLKRGRSTAFCEGSAIDADGNTVCIARATFRLIPRKD